MDRIYLCSFIIVFSAFISSISQIMLKISAKKIYNNKLNEYINPLVISGYFLFFLCTLINIFALKYVPLSLAPILESSGYVFVTMLGHVVLKEHIRKRKLYGIIVILLGIFVFAF